MTREEITNSVGYAQEKANLEYIKYRQEHGVNDPYMITEIDEAFDAGFDKGYQYAQTHPNWISVEDEPYPPKKNKWDKRSEEVLIYGLWMGRPTRLFGTYHYDTNEWGANGLISNITHWMEIQPPRKED